MSRSYITRNSQSVTLTLLSGGKGESESALSPFGPVRVASTISPNLSIVRGEQDHQLLALLSTLEKQVEILRLRFCEASDTFLTGTTHLVEPTLSSVDTTGIDVLE